MQLVKEYQNSTIYRDGNLCIKRPKVVVDPRVVDFLKGKEIPHLITPLDVKNGDEHYVWYDFSDAYLRPTGDEFMQAAKGLHELHKLGIVHGDVKFWNFVHLEQVKIFDYHLSHFGSDFSRDIGQFFRMMHSYPENLSDICMEEAGRLSNNPSEPEDFLKMVWSLI